MPSDLPVIDMWSPIVPSHEIMRGTDALRDLEYWIREREFRGLSLRPLMIRRPASDRHYSPFYATAPSARPCPS